MNLEEAEKCPKCGKEFSCSKSSKCWCFEIQISSEIQEAIRNQYDSCLCSDCLKEYSQKNS